MKNINQKIIAITGGIGSGKSFSIKILKDLGYPVLSCDETATYVLKKNYVLRKIKREFPTAVSGFIKLNLNRKELSKIVFNDKKELIKLNSITHPIIIKNIFKNAKKEKNNIVFIEFPLLFEGGYQKLFYDVLIINRDLSTRIESVMKRNNLTKEEVISRINSQFNYELIDKTSYHIIYNDGNEETLKEKLKQYLKTL